MSANYYFDCKCNLAVAPSYIHLSLYIYLYLNLHNDCMTYGQMYTVY